MNKHKVVVFGPSLGAVSGVSTHVRMLIDSDLSRHFELMHFQVGSEGRNENALQRLSRLAFGPFSLAFLLMRSRAEIVHLNTSLDAKGYWRDLVFAAVTKALGRRVINQIHGGAMPQDFFGGNALLTWILRRFLVASDVVTVLSSAELAAYKAFDPRIKIHLIPNAIDPVGLANVARPYNTSGPLNLVYVGRLVRGKGLFELVEALAQMKSEGRRFTLLVAGDGPDRTALIAATERAGLKDRVRFLGTVFADNKRRLLLESDLFVFPSYSEGLPYSLLEAMAAGCVPVTTAVAAIPDVMRDGQHGLFVPVRDPRALAKAMASCDDDRASLARMAEAARQRILEHYTLPRLADDFRGLYDRCLC